MTGKERFIVILTLILSFVSFLQGAYRPSDLVNPNIADRRRYVADPGELLTTSARNQADKILWDLRQNTSAEVAVVVVPDIGDMPIEDFATQLFTEWGIGKKDNDNGVLVVIATEQREARIATGYGVEGVLPDISAKKIINRSIVPFMKNNDLDGAVKAVATDLANVLTSPSAAEELKSSSAERWEEMPQSDITGEDILGFAGIIAFLIFLVSVGVYIYDSRRLRNKDRYLQAREWHDKQLGYLTMAIFSAGLGLLPYLLARHKYKTARNKPLTCPTCHHKMRKLNEDQDNALLSPSQDLEERLNTVDYDVWVCPDCGTVERYPFRIRQNTYTECPNCHTVAYHLVRDHTLVAPTIQHTGLGEKIYECKYCNNRTNKRYTIPKKPDPAAAAIAAGAILGSGRNGGGGFGGGFGGGGTGGGGASGRW